MLWPQAFQFFDEPAQDLESVLPEIVMMDIQAYLEKKIVQTPGAPAFQKPDQSGQERILLLSVFLKQGERY